MRDPETSYRMRDPLVESIKAVLKENEKFLNLLRITHPQDYHGLRILELINKFHYQLIPFIIIIPG
jgi:hypothetical protein